MPTNKLIEATMEAMGFTEQVRACQYCVFYKGQDEGPHVCTYSSICHFPVSFNTSCNHFTPRPKPTTDDTE